ncbi:DUF3149 domain-containing protein [Acidovorax radicis]|uniref:DUF3149 domain-containing protein n=1 Tax=Acidovorax radicis TaxID=758826 RepID=UPI001CF81F3C|nr:DUF3149 domain-containing protein [Acidovorax radicis]UCU97805.1 DUF3149 domain-containing protein [Acidovorax radicis]
MKLLHDLFTTPYGLMSIIGIGFMLCMAGFFLRMFLGKMGAPQSPEPGKSVPTGGSKTLPPSR